MYTKRNTQYDNQVSQWIIIYKKYIELHSVNSIYKWEILFKSINQWNVLCLLSRNHFLLHNKKRLVLAGTLYTQVTCQ